MLYWYWWMWWYVLAQYIECSIDYQSKWEWKRGIFRSLENYLTSQEIFVIWSPALTLNIYVNGDFDSIFSQKSLTLFVKRSAAIWIEKYHKICRTGDCMDQWVYYIRFLKENSRTSVMTIKQLELYFSVVVKEVKRFLLALKLMVLWVWL